MKELQACLHKPWSLVAVSSTLALSLGRCTGASCSSIFFCTQLPDVSDWMELGLVDVRNEWMVSMDFPCYPCLPLPGVRRGRGWGGSCTLFSFTVPHWCCCVSCRPFSSISSQASLKSSIWEPSQEQIPAACPRSWDSHPSVGWEAIINNGWENRCSFIVIALNYYLKKKHSQCV